MFCCSCRLYRGTVLLLLLLINCYLNPTSSQDSAISDGHDHIKIDQTVESTLIGLDKVFTPINDVLLSTNTSNVTVMSVSSDIDGSFQHQRSLAADDLIIQAYPVSNSLSIFIDPPSGATSPAALGVFVRASSPTAKIFYAFESDPLTEAKSLFTTNKRPYIQIDTPYGYKRQRYMNVVAVDNGRRSKVYNLTYAVEGAARPGSFAFIVPGIESSGYFLKLGIEMKASARAQTAGGQEFADFFTKLGVGTYKGQIAHLHLPTIDPDLTAFEGGAAVNCSNGKHYGVLFPFHNGQKFFGKVVRVDLGYWQNTTKYNSSDKTCFNNWRMESYERNASGHVNIKVTGKSYNRGTHTFYDNIIPERSRACIFILDLSTVHSHARGFRRGFVGYPYVYLSPGEFNIPVRINVEKWGIEAVEAVDLDLADSKLGGYSSGFVDGAWSCFIPFRTYYGPVGGIRSKNVEDQEHLRSYYHGQMLCLNENAYLHRHNATIIKESIRTLDTSNMLPDLRGFSDAIKVGRYAYLSPFASLSHQYVGRMVRIDLGSDSIGAVIDTIIATGAPVSSVLSVLDLSIVASEYKGFSSIFQSGMYLFLVPYRNNHEPSNGQRGHGNLVRLNMNDFSVTGVDGVNLGTLMRTQVPSFPDEDFRGFSYGFASGKYGILVPFYNAIFSGKFARFLAFGPAKISDSMVVEEMNLQQLDTTIDGLNPDTFKGFRGAFVSRWNGVDEDFYVS